MSGPAPQIEQTRATSSAKDTALLLAGVGLVIGALFVYYGYTAELKLPWRVLILLASVAIGALVAYQSAPGKAMYGYYQGMWVELRKTTWPTRQESVQTTVMIAVVVLIASLLLWGLDSVLLWGVKGLTGRG